MSIRSYFILFCIAAVGFMSNGCTDGGFNEFNFDQVNNALVGTWKWDTATLNGEPTDFDELRFSNRLTFRTDGTMTEVRTVKVTRFVNDEQTFEDIWVLSDDASRIVFEGRNLYQILRISDIELEVQYITADNQLLTVAYFK